LAGFTAHAARLKAAARTTIVRVRFRNPAPIVSTIGSTPPALERSAFTSIIGFYSPVVACTSASEQSITLIDSFDGS
jgi:hypothetical protein